MKVPISWLKDFVDIDIDIPELCARLVGCGFEVEDVFVTGSEIENVVVGRIVALAKHPNADKLQICTIDVGSHDMLQIVTGATNVFVGAVVPVALDGAKLPGGKEIHSGSLRGVESCGMLCGGEELGVDDYDYAGASVDGILILAEDTPIGVDIKTVVGLGEIVLDVAITANRPDCNSILGIAKEVAAVTGKTIRMWADLPYTTVPADTVDVEVLDNALCPRYMAQKMTDIVICPSPSIIARRLKLVDIRPINNIVDMTNYVLTEIGQPMHAFDADITRSIVVRRAEAGEKITALNDTEYTLTNDMLVICDETKPVAIAGIMGGMQSGISATTTSIILESAKFARDNVRRTSRRLNLRSDSSARFEKGIDMYSQELAIARCINLVKKYSWGRICAGHTDICATPSEDKTLTYTSADITRILGISVPDEDILRILNSLELRTVLTDGIFSTIVTPTREDVVGINDIAEEVIRVYGYDNITGTIMDGAHQTIGGKEPFLSFCDDIRALLIARGNSEILTYSFVSPRQHEMLLDNDTEGDIRLFNPLGEDLSVMRRTLVGSMLNTLKTNFTRFNKEASLFEIAKVYIPHALPLAELPEETVMLSFGEYGVDSDFFSIKRNVVAVLDAFKLHADYDYSQKSYLHPGRSADVTLDGEYIGSFGEVHPKVSEKLGYDKRLYAGEINLTKLFRLWDRKFVYTNIPKFPESSRDIAVTVSDKIPASALEKYLRELGVPCLVSANVFDVYTGSHMSQGTKSVALKLVFQADRTLVDSFVNEQMEFVLQALETKFNAKIRG